MTTPESTTNTTDTDCCRGQVQPGVIILPPCDRHPHIGWDDVALAPFRRARCPACLKEWEDQRKALLDACKSAYLKMTVDGCELGSEEVIAQLTDALCTVMNDEFIEWAESHDAVLGRLMENYELRD